MSTASALAEMSKGLVTLRLNFLLSSVAQQDWEGFLVYLVYILYLKKRPQFYKWQTDCVCHSEFMLTISCRIIDSSY